MLLETTKAVRPLFTSRRAAKSFAEYVLSNYSLLPQSMLDSAGDMDLDDAVDFLVECDDPDRERLPAAVVSILGAAGCRDINESTILVERDRIFCGTPSVLNEIPDAVPGEWAVVFTVDFTAVVCEAVEFDDLDGYYQVFHTPAFGVYGVWSDTTACTERFEALGPGVCQDGFAAKTKASALRIAVHRRTDGRCDAIFIQEVK